VKTRFQSVPFKCNLQRYIVDAAIEGYNGTIFCYGQTGTVGLYTLHPVDP
jgi:hypothetical protein